MVIIKVLGSGCANCTKLEAFATKAATELGLEAGIVKVTDVAQIMAYGVMSTPALVIDEELKVVGRVPTYDEVVALLQRSAS